MGQYGKSFSGIRTDRAVADAEGCRLMETPDPCDEGRRHLKWVLSGLPVYYPICMLKMSVGLVSEGRDDIPEWDASLQRGTGMSLATDGAYYYAVKL